MNELNDDEFKDLAEILRNILKKLKTINASYNFVLHYAPKGKDLHFHIEVMPRISILAGFELGSGDLINTVSSEEAGEFYRT